MTATEIAPELSTRLDALIEDETAPFVERQPGSAAMTERARTLAGGATSSWQIAEPQAVWISHGAGSKIYDVDGNEYSDFHGGYGVSPRRARPPRDRRGGPGPGPPRHPLRPADRGRRSSSPTTCPSGSASRCGASATPAPRRRWTPST